ncbi:hypothetical protein F8O05_09950 [Gulosibacter chungangensis]|uniref:Uncharacterized protein n=1 Tax=Gulosibacter chungangensis TaxID=979746 RepID=A0A7J5B987_9MICO|nr:hypothetical protein F8O05_09950 [Gulosibacter chungangensis]
MGRGRRSRDHRSGLNRGGFSRGNRDPSRTDRCRARPGAGSRCDCELAPELRGDGARIWFFVEGQTVFLEQVHTSHPNETK